MAQIAFAHVINVNKEAFLRKLLEVSQKLRVDPSWLMIVIKIESGFNRKARNKTSGTVGLFQWFPKYARKALIKMRKATKYSPDWILERTILGMSGVEQLELIGHFLEDYAGRMTDQYQLYLAVFWPAAMGKSDHYVIGRRNDPEIRGKAYRWNKYLDTKFGNNDGEITVSEVKAFVDHFAKDAFPKGFKPELKKDVSRKICPCCKRPY